MKKTFISEMKREEWLIFRALSGISPQRLNEIALRDALESQKALMEKQKALLEAESA